MVGVRNIPASIGTLETKLLSKSYVCSTHRYLLSSGNASSAAVRHGEIQQWQKDKVLALERLTLWWPGWGRGGRTREVHKQTYTMAGGEKCHERRKAGWGGRQGSRDPSHGRQCNIINTPECTNCSQTLPAQWSVKMRLCKALASTWVSYWRPEGLD